MIAILKRNSYRILLLLFFWITAIWLQEKTPDWFAYEQIFENGAWLEAGGRDLGFLLVIKWFKFFFGENYFLFRLLLNIFFSLTLVYFTTRQFNFNKKEYRFNAIGLLVIFPFIFIRFTVQIREAVADILIMVGLNYLFTYGGKKGLKLVANLTLVFIIFLIAFTIHSGVFFFIFFFLFFLILNYYNKLLNFLSNKYVASFLYTVLFIFLFYYLSGQKDSYYTGGDVERPLTISKFLFWLLWGGIIYIIVHWNNSWVVNEIRNQEFTLIFFTFIFNRLILLIYALAIVVLITQISNAVLSAIARIINLIVCINIIIISKFIQKQKFLFVLVSIFLVIDQLRILLDVFDNYEL